MTHGAWLIYIRYTHPSYLYPMPEVTVDSCSQFLRAKGLTVIDAPIAYPDELYQIATEAAQVDAASTASSLQQG